MKIATATKLKLVFGAIIVAGALTAFVVQQQNQTKLRDENESLQQQIAQLQTNNENFSNQLANVGDAKKLTDEQFNELLKLRGEVGVLRWQLDELAKKNRALQNVNTAMLGSNTNPPAPQIHIKARFLTAPKDVLAGFGMDGPTRFIGVLTSANTSNALSQLQSRNDIEILGEPEVVTTGGRQVQMRATQVINVITNFTLQESNNISGIVPQTATVETGPILDVMPRVLSDGYMIELPVIASVTGFLGYAQPTNATTPACTAAGQEVDVPTISPQFHVQQATNSVDLPDGQTLVLTLNENQVSTGATSADATVLESAGSKQTVVFITASIVDPAGNLVHTNAGSHTNTFSPASGQ